jgi:serine/threonine protein phosphatase 1
MFLECFTNPELMRHFLRFGGRETVLSYPVDRAAFDRATSDGATLDGAAWDGAALDSTGVTQAQALMRAAVPESDLAFIRGFEDRIVVGDYLFVHAGIRPGVPLERQALSDLRWIRGAFTDWRGDHGLVVVHGHTIFAAADVRPNRIGIDTGAYRSGTLTALRLEGTNRSLLETRELETPGGAARIAVHMRSIP